MRRSESGGHVGGGYARRAFISVGAVGQRPLQPILVVMVRAWRLLRELAIPPRFQMLRLTALRGAMVVAAAIGAAGAPAHGGEAPQNARWLAIEPSAIEGQGWRDVQSPFDRLPGRAEGLVRDSVWKLARHSAGLNVRFVSDAPSIWVRWTLTGAELAKPHMPASGVSGVDLYVRRDGKWYFAGAGIPKLVGQNEAEVVGGMEAKQRELLLYLPLYNGVSQVELGVPAGASLTMARSRAERPIVFYGTSITQGGCASRAGMSYPAILGRRLGVPVINLGFSGNGKAEPEVAHLLAELEPAAFVLDPLGNLLTEQVAERLPAFIEILRERHPETPILLHENVYYPTTRFVPARLERVEASNAVLHAILKERVAAGDRHISIIPACDLTTDDGATTVDGTHPTDLGFLRMADAMEPYLQQVLEGG